MWAQVVPDVAPGFNVPPFYEGFVEERRQHVAEQAQRRASRRAHHDVVRPST